MLDFDAGKYAPYVWSAYAISALVLGVMIAGSLNQARRWRRRAEDLTGK